MFYHIETSLQFLEFRSLDFCLCRQLHLLFLVKLILSAILPYCMSLTSKCRHLLIGNQNTVDKNTFTPRLHLPVNARAKNMFSTDVKRLCFRCQTLKFPRPKLKVT